MKIKKLCAAAISAVMMAGMLTTASAVSKESSNKDDLSSILGNKYEVTEFTASAAGSNLRRPISNEQPMLIVHIDTWNYADPAKIIDLIPKDILPYVVFNISLSINWSGTEHKWLMVQDGYECAKSWMKTCADKGVWTMIQPASGGQCHFPDYDTNGNIIKFPNQGQFAQSDGGDLENSVFAEFFRDYDSFIGYNYCEQFWGFAQQDFPITYQQRYQHFANLLKLCNKYGGYLDISVCENQWGTALNPVGLLKQVPEWKDACTKYSENLILEEKYTQLSYIADIESEVYGAYVAGYCGNFGVRWDDTGWSDYPWTDNNPPKDQYRVSRSLPVFFERMVQNGMTVIDGPELVWADDFRETWGTTDSDGYHVRGWEMYDQYQNVILDLFRKTIDGTIRIPDRKEVIDRNKVVVIQDVTSGNDESKYSSYPSLFEGLYRISNDGNLRDNHNPFKSTGRYQTIPTIVGFADDMAKSIPVQVKQSEIAKRWATIDAKKAEFDKLYPSDFWGNCYIGRNENTWTAYNPNKTTEAAGGVMNLKYNTCKNVDISFTEYGSAVMNEYSDHIDFYLNNYDEDAKETLKTTTIKIAGCSSEPTVSFKDRGVNQAKSTVQTGFADGTYTITVKHNGPLDLSVACKGSETNRQTAYKTANLIEPSFPGFYEGERQYEAEFFDYKNIEENVTNGCKSGITGYWGQGFMKFGTKANAAVKDTVSSTKSGTFTMKLRYAITSDVSNVDLYVNGKKVKMLSLPKGSSMSDWKTITEKIDLNAGDNTIELKATAALPSSLYLDNFIVVGDFGEGTPSVINGKLIQNLIVKDKENKSDWSIGYDFGKGSVLFGDRELTAASVPEYLVGAEAIKTACDSKMYSSDQGTFTAGADITVYVAMDSRVSEALPEWIGSYKKTADAIVTDPQDLKLEVYKKNFKAGETVTLGVTGGSGDNVNYIVLAAEQEIEPISGKLIKDLNIFDRENGADWSIADGLKDGEPIYGDRDISLKSVPKNLVNAEVIKTACDSKMSTEDLGIFTAGEDITIYVAMDTRVTDPVQPWLESFKKTGFTLESSGDFSMVLFKKNVKAGEKVTLGTNSGNGMSANYTVFAVPQEKIVKGDAALNGKINIFDLCIAKSGLNYGFDNTAVYDAADVNNDGVVEMSDIVQMQKYIAGNIKSFEAK